MKYTLFAFQLHESELKEVNGKPSAIANLLAELSDHRVEICAGVHVFETQKGWSDMHQLRLFLISTNKTFVELPFESALAGFFSAEVCEELQTLAEKSGAELSLLNLNRDV
ncbi:MAG TPA: hypothetical protein VIW64_09040 [Pyrinomonadaceae bacterium]